MIDYSIQEQVQLIKSVFLGREDVFAIRWEKGNKSGYSPAYVYDQYMYRAHKMKGGTFQNYADKTYLELTDREIAKHLNGEQLVGIYPLLKDNTSNLIVADFDKDKWLEECNVFLKACEEKGIPAYLERSRSGKGGHVWIFFEQPYPAFRSRKIVLSMLEQSGAFSAFDKSKSFDRLFPNQDFLSGKGLGNLIALPLFKKSMEQGNRCFIHSDTLEPIQDQFQFLKNIKKVPVSELERFHESISSSKIATLSNVNNDKLTISLNNVVKISRIGMTTALIAFLKEELNFVNVEFMIKKKVGRNTFGTEHYYKFIDETEHEVIIPRGFVGKLIRFCRENKIEHDFIDERKKHKEISFSFNTILREYQQGVIETISKKDLGVIVAPPGSGKTIMALRIISEKQQPALIVVHRKQLVEQWAERIGTFLNISKNEIGKIGQGKRTIGNRITIATIQSLSKEIVKVENKEILTAFGTVIVDECHHIPAETFRKTLERLQTFYLYGLTATPFRKHNDGKLIFIHLGEVIAEIKSLEISTSKQPKIIIRNTELDVPFNSKIDKFETLSKILIHDSTRNKLLLEDVFRELKLGKKAVIISERKEHIDSLHQYLKQTYETVKLHGEDSESSRSAKWKILKDGNYQVLITTGQYFGEGTDLQNANCLFLVYPFAFEGKLIQYIGRVQRSEVAPTIYDYRDIRIDYLNKLFLKRNVYYRKIERQANLFDEPTEDIVDSKNNTIIEREIRILIEDLEFRYGSIAFKYIVPELKTELDFEIENLEIRPEFEVLKPYFTKALKSKYIKFAIHAEYEDGKLISQIATSNDVQKINHEVIEGVKFKFITKNILGTNTYRTESLLDINQIQEQNKNKLYNSGEELLEDVLKRGYFKHHKQLSFLSQRHDRGTLKVRFVLSPFSFVFLLIGKEQFHIVLETLDTKEATYLWHFAKNRPTLKMKLKEIDQQLGVIKNKGRQFFLQNKSEDFSRILHDYSDEKKGFIVWKGLLEEQIS